MQSYENYSKLSLKALKTKTILCYFFYNAFIWLIWFSAHPNNIFFSQRIYRINRILLNTHPTIRSIRLIRVKFLRTLTICVDPYHPWENINSHRTRRIHRPSYWNILPQMPQMFTDIGAYFCVHSVGVLPHPHESVQSALIRVKFLRTLTICVDPCHPWENITQEVLCVPCIPWKFLRTLPSA